MSLKNEKSEPAESEERRGLTPRFSSCSSSSPSGRSGESSSDWDRRDGGIRLRRGIPEEGVEEGMVPACGAG